jgi:dextranase
MTLRIRDFYALQAYYQPAEPLTFRAEIESSARRQAGARLTVIRPGAAPRRVSRSIALDRGLTAVDFAVTVAGRARHGYVVELDVEEDGDRSSGVTSADVLRSWQDDPRYGFLSEFSHTDQGIERRVARAARYHLNCLQFYDWMYRHYRLLPPRDQFRDALGRRLSLGTVRRGIEACHQQRTAALAYAAVYAAEPEFFRKHRHWGLYRPDGSSYQLGRLFHLMDLAPDSPWVRHLLSDFRRTLQAVPFDGFHLDQYGFPRVGYTKAGTRRDVARDLAGFIDAAAGVARRRGADAGVIFNAVNGWPVEHVARRNQVATYIEVWPPHVTYADLVRLVRRTHDLAPGKPVILAAYASFLRSRPARRAAAASSLALLSAVIFAVGAWHLLLGEGDQALTHAYYPKHERLPAEAARTLRRYYDFAVAYREFLRDARLRDVAAQFVDSAEPSFRASLPYASTPTPGRIWVGMRAKPGWVIISLVNLLDESDLTWDRARKGPTTQSVALRLPDELRIRRCLVASPDGDGSLAPVPYRPGGRNARTIRLALSTWTLVLVETDR